MFVLEIFTDMATIPLLSQTTDSKDRAKPSENGESLHVMRTFYSQV
jgi:hypothetical protein